jgi:hypothetical protein
MPLGYSFRMEICKMCVFLLENTYSGRCSIIHKTSQVVMAGVESLSYITSILETRSGHDKEVVLS